MGPAHSQFAELEGPISRQDGEEMDPDELDAIEQRVDPYTGTGRDTVRLLAEVRRLRSLGGDHLQ